MRNSQKAQGDHHEALVLTYLTNTTGHNYRPSRPTQSTFRDQGDIHLGPFALQLKSSSRGVSQATNYLMDAREQAATAGLPFGAAVIKNQLAPGVDADLVVMDLETFTVLLNAATEGSWVE